REVLGDLDVVLARSEVAAVVALEQQLDGARSGGLDDAPGERPAGDALRSLGEEAGEHLLVRRTPMGLDPGPDPLAGLVGQLEEVAAGLGAELAAAAVEEGGPAGLVEAVGGIQRDVRTEPARRGRLREALGDLAPLVVAEVDRAAVRAVAEVDRALA